MVSLDPAVTDASLLGVFPGFFSFLDFRTSSFYFRVMSITHVWFFSFCVCLYAHMLIYPDLLVHMCICNILKIGYVVLVLVEIIETLIWILLEYKTAFVMPMAYLMCISGFCIRAYGGPTKGLEHLWIGVSTGVPGTNPLQMGERGEQL